MPKVFGRERADHPLEPALQALLQGEDAGGDEQVAMAWNFRHDWRVSEPRELKFVSTTVSPVTPNGLRESLSAYVQNQVRARRFDKNDPPDFLHAALNGHNQLSRHPNWWLVHLINIGGLAQVLEAAVVEFGARAAFHDLPRRLSPLLARARGFRKTDGFFGPALFVQALDAFLSGQSEH